LQGTGWFGMVFVFFLLHKLSSWVELSLHAKFQCPTLFGSGCLGLFENEKSGKPQTKFETPQYLIG
jgi:hypothetical protein